MQFLGYIMPPDELKKRGWAKSTSEMEPDPIVESHKRGKAWDKYVEEKEIIEYERDKEGRTRGKYL